MTHAKKGKKEHNSLNKGKKMEAVKPLTVCSGDFTFTSTTSGATPTLMK